MNNHSNRLKDDGRITRRQIRNKLTNLGYRSWHKESSKSESKGRRNLELASFIAGILGFFVSSFFAAITYINTEQIDKLDSLIRLNTENIGTLAKVTDELKKENQNLASIDIALLTQLQELRQQNYNLIGINERLANQLGITKLQYQILDHQYNLDSLDQSITSQEKIAKRKEDSLALLDNLGSLITETFLQNFRNYDSAKQVKYMQHIRGTLFSMLTNKFLEENDKLVKYLAEYKGVGRPVGQALYSTHT